MLMELLGASPQGLTTSEIRARLREAGFEVARATVHRDLEGLVAAGVELEERKGPDAQTPRWALTGKGGRAKSVRFEDKGAVWVRLVFGSEAAKQVVGRCWHSSQTMSGRGEGVELAMRVGVDETLRRWILGFGSGVVVEEPKELREWLGREGKILAERYE
jgi:predicted DNA-binding transcriptional regulator YafY